MPVFIWKGRDRQGRKAKGEIEAENVAIARQLLLRQGITIHRLKPKPKDLSDYISFLGGRVKEKDLVIFVRQFATMINAGIPILQCLETLGEQSESKTLKTIVKRVARDVEAGETLSGALKKYPKIFDHLFTNLVAAGEAGGILDIILERLAGYIEKIARLKKRIRGALTYPAVVVSVAVVVITVILLYVIPVFADLFRDAGVALPGMTLAVIHLSDFVKSHFHWMILGLILLVFGFRRIRRTNRGRLIIDHILLRLPVFGILIKKAAVARFARTLGTMLSSGVPILEALDIVASASGNKVVENAVRKAKDSIARGETVATPLAESGIFPPMVIHMVSIGEDSGALDVMLDKIADFYDEEVDAAVESLTSLLEPLLIVFLGITVGGLLVAMYLPIFQLADVVGRGA